MIELIHGDCLEKLKELENNSVDSVVTDPPYGLSFMGKKWDYDVPSEDIWRECLRVLKPGGHLLAFAGTRTQHRMAVRIEDAGFEIRDMIAWIYGVGFPKSLNISKAIDKAAGAEREKVMVPTKAGNHPDQAGDISLGATGMTDISKPVTEAAKQWEGWGTALKPALEPITVARKPLSGKTVAENVLTHGTGGINIDGCRVEAQKGDKFGGGGLNSPVNGFMGNTDNTYKKGTGFRDDTAKGRFPANLIHDGSEEVVGLFPANIKGSKATGLTQTKARSWKNTSIAGINRTGYEDNGSAARFFYCAKASKKDRDNEGAVKNIHATVKPTDLMRYLCRLVTPPGGIVLDPFMGSGSTGKAAVKEGFSFIGIEREAEYVDIAKARIGV